MSIAIIDIIFYLSIPVGLIIGFMYGEERLLGTFWGVFFTITFSFIIGLIIIHSSPKRNGHLILKNNKPSIGKYILAGVFFIISVLCLIMVQIIIEPAFDNVYRGKDFQIYYHGVYRFVCISAGFIGSGIYLMQNRKLIKQDAGSSI